MTQPLFSLKTQGKPTTRASVPRLVLSCLLVFSLACCLVPRSFSQPAKAPASTIPALFVSDIHFEPFWDPAKIADLDAAPVAQWDTILAAPASADRTARFAALQKACHAKGIDTSYPLLQSSLKAMRAHAGQPRFIILSGDLISHDFSCKFRVALPHAADGDYSRFAGKTLAFALLQLRNAFPGVPVYAALGNNDSGCGDYRLDPGSEFLALTGKAVAQGLPPADRAGVEQTFATDGDYSAALPAPLRHTRLLVLDDLFMAHRYTACSGAPDPKPAAAQIAWLRQELATARSRHERIWIMAHMPPGIDAYSTARKMRDVCGGEPADTFLASNDLASTISDFGDVVRLVIFGHTHMDELRLLEPAGGASPAHPAVPVKLVSSISPVDGNLPSFTVGEIDAATATLFDDRVFAASDAAGSSWSQEYDFRDAYREPAFTGSSISDLVARFHADSKAQSPASEAYLRNYFVGGRALELRAFWPAYVCSLAHLTPQSYRACVCSPAP